MAGTCTHTHIHNYMTQSLGLFLAAAEDLWEVCLAVSGSVTHVLEATQHLGLHVVSGDTCRTAIVEATCWQPETKPVRLESCHNIAWPLYVCLSLSVCLSFSWSISLSLRKLSKSPVTLNKVRLTWFILRSETQAWGDITPSCGHPWGPICLLNMGPCDPFRIKPRYITVRYVKVTETQPSRYYGYKTCSQINHISILHLDLCDLEKWSKRGPNGLSLRC